MDEESIADVLLVDRDPSIGREVISFLSGRHYDVEWVDDGEKAYNCLDSRPFDAMVTDLNLRRVDGMRLMGVAKNRNPDICVIMITEDPDIELATEAMRQGAYDFQTKPLNMGKLEAVIQRGLGYQQLVYEQFQLKRRLDERYGLAGLVGKSRAMVHAYATVRQAAPSALPVIIVGEPGTGKDLLAHAIHNNGPRRDRMFVKVNCSSGSEALLEGELLGSAAGVSAGVSARGSEGSVGRIELADKGTLYLDQASALPLHLHEPILNLLETKQVQRVGGAKPIASDVRIIVSATPGARKDEGPQSFFEEIQRRCGAMTIDLPALRFRKEDIPLLIDRFVAEAGRASQKTVTGITRNALDILTQYDWPGNVGELRNIVEGMLVAAPNGEPLDVRDVPDALRRNTPPGPNDIRIPAGTSMGEVERIVIEETMRSCGHNKELCAKTLGIGLRTLYRKLKEYESR